MHEDRSGLITCDDGRTFKSTSRLQALHGETPNSMRNKAMVLGTRAQYLIWSELLAAVRTNQAQAGSALGAPIFDYYADHAEEAAIFRATMQDVSEGVLENCRHSMRPNARLVAFEAFFAGPGEEIPVNMIDTQVPLFDLHLMLAVNGKERTIAEYSALFERVGLRRINTTPLDNGYMVIEAAAA